MSDEEVNGRRSSSAISQLEGSTIIDEGHPCEEEENVEIESEDDYETEDFISQPKFSPESTFEEDPLELDSSYGYDCQNPNLCVVDAEHLLWYTGNVLHIFNVKQRRLTFRRSALGQDISFIAKSKCSDEFAVAENGGEMGSPMIIVYKWPNLKVQSVLRGGATKCYKCVDFSMDGCMLISQAGRPDDTLTIWNLKTTTAIASFQNPDETVSKAVFSPYDPDIFITCGTGHIKFWRIVDTFTGLKIQSEPGRFGEIENNDVTAVCFLPEGRIASNFCGGNMAVWRPNASLEISLSMKNGEPCHADLITFIRIYLEDNHVYSAGLDGKIRVWNYSYITGFYDDEQIDSIHIDVEPSYERTIKDRGRTGKPILALPKDDKTHPYHFYVQDVKGGIWLLDLELKKNPDPWSLLYSCHSGPIYDMSPSPGDHYLATTGQGGKMIVYSQKDKTIALVKEFDEDGTSILWLPFKADSKGCTIVVGFTSGMLKIVVIRLKCTRKISEGQAIRVVQALRPHSSSIVALSTDHFARVLVSGSTDGSVFLYSFDEKQGITTVSPLGMIVMPGPVTDITWNPYRISQKIFAVSCSNGQVAEVTIGKREWATMKRTNREQMKLETFVLNVNMTITPTKVRSTKDDDKLYFSRYLGEDLIWIEETSSGHSYHNYLYKGGEPVAKLNISDGNTVQCCTEVHGGRYMVLGLNNGRIKIIKKTSEVGNFSDSWEIAMHQTRGCTIKKLCTSYDGRILYSCGTDSGIFAYKLNLKSDFEVGCSTLPFIEELPEGIEEVVPELSLEQEKIKRKTDKERMEHGRRVKKFKRQLNGFLNRYQRLIEINKSLPKDLRVPKSFFRLETEEERAEEKRKMMEREEEIVAPLKKRQESLFEKVRTLKKHFIDPIKTPKFYLFAIRAPHYLKSFPERKLFTKDPLGETDDPDKAERDAKWERLLAGKEDPQPECTEFERMSRKIVAKLEKAKEIETYYDQTKGGTCHNRDLLAGEKQSAEEVPDLITAAGKFLSEHDKFTPTEKAAFERINKNRLGRRKCAEAMEKVDKARTGFQGYYDKIEALFNNLVKTEAKDQNKMPPLTEKLHHLLNVRQLIYLSKEKFNRSLGELRKEKRGIINYFYWAQREYQYMVEDMKQWKLDLDGTELPPPLQVVWDLEYPDSLTFKPGPMPLPIAERMEQYEKEIDQIQKIVPIDALKAQPDMHNQKLFSLIKTRQERFTSNVILIREELDGMVKRFDDKFLPLLLKRTKTSLEVNELKSEYSSVLMEVDVLYRFEILQTSASSYKYDTLKVKHVQILRENVRKNKIEGYNEQVRECHRTIEDLNAKFVEMVKDDRWAKHLGRIYKRKFRAPKGSESEESDQSSETSDDNDVDFDDISGGEDESTGAGVAYLYDENILPPGCDEEKFKQTFKYRSQRHVEESRIVDIRRDKEALTEEVKGIRKIIKITDVLLALFFSGTFRFHKMMKDELDQIEFLVHLSPEQIQIFDENDPLNNVPPIDECKLIEQDDYALKVKTLEQLKVAIQEVAELVDKTHEASKNQVKDLEKLSEQNDAKRREIEKLLATKFGEKVDVDGGQTFVLTEMVKKAFRKCAKDLEDRAHRGQSDLNRKESLRRNEELIATKKERIKTLQTLYTIEAEKNRIAADKLSHRQRGTSSKMNLSKERESLLKDLARVEDQEKRLIAALKDV